MTIKQINHHPTGSISDTQTPQYRQTGRGLLACSDDVIQNISQFILKNPQDKHNLALVNKRFAKISQSIPLPQGSTSPNSQSQRASVDRTVQATPHTPPQHTPTWTRDFPDLQALEQYSDISELLPRAVAWFETNKYLLDDLEENDNRRTEALMQMMQEFGDQPTTNPYQERDNE